MLIDGRDSVPAGVWQHRKGGRYLVLGVARHDTTDEPLVVYVRLYSRDGLPMSARPVADWLSDAEVEGTDLPRFTFLGSTDPGPSETTVENEPT